MSAHTPGPWKADPFRLVIGGVEGPVMSYLVGNKASAPGNVVSIASERLADHYLCASAPDLLAALQSLANVVQDEYGFEDCEPIDSEGRRGQYDTARAAIAKALGK